jgi:hypothetical protein
MGFADGQTQAIFGLRHGDQMNVIGHQAIAPNLHALFTTPVGHQFHIGRIVAIVEKRLLATVAALRDVMRQTRNDQPCQHTTKVYLFCQYWYCVAGMGSAGMGRPGMGPEPDKRRMPSVGKARVKLCRRERGGAERDWPVGPMLLPVYAPVHQGVALIL